MTTRLIDGPAKGVSLELRRMPVFLRVVHDGKTWEWDALDWVDDTPKATETIFVYRRTAQIARGFACSRGRGCEAYFVAEYSLYAPQPDQELLRDRELWQCWAQEEAARLKAADDPLLNPEP